MPATTPLSRGESTALPPQAASTWNHIPCSVAASASFSRGSTIPALVVPAVPTIISGCQSDARSASIRDWRASISIIKRLSVGISRSASVPKAGHPRHLHERVVRLTGQVNRGPALSPEEARFAPLRNVLSKGAKHGRQVRFRASCREIRMQCLCIDVQRAREWTQGQLLHFIGCWCVRPSSELRIVKATSVSAMILAWRTLGLNRPK